jgi:hypothetical protein
LQITAVTAAAAHRVAAHDPVVAAHPWLARAADYCLSAIQALDQPPFAYVLAFSVRFLDALHGTRPEQAEPLLDHLATFIPDDGHLRVVGGTENERLHPLDLAPYPGRPARQLFSEQVISVDVRRLAALQQDDGGWVVDYLPISPAGSLEWRGHATARACDILSKNE